MLHVTRGLAYFLANEKALSFTLGNAARLLGPFPVDSDADEFFYAL